MDCGGARLNGACLPIYEVRSGPGRFGDEAEDLALGLSRADRAPVDRPLVSGHRECSEVVLWRSIGGSLLSGKGSQISDLVELVDDLMAQYFFEHVFKRHDATDGPKLIGDYH